MAKKGINTREPEWRGVHCERGYNDRGRESAQRSEVNSWGANWELRDRRAERLPAGSALLLSGSLRIFTLFQLEEGEAPQIRTLAPTTSGGVRTPAPVSRQQWKTNAPGGANSSLAEWDKAVSALWSPASWKDPVSSGDGVPSAGEPAALGRTQHG